MSDSVLIIGGGVAGVQAALDMANAGSQVVLLERRPNIGGAMAARLGEESLEEEFVDVPDVPDLHSVMGHENIEVLTLSELVKLSGDAGAFRATIRQEARFVTDACTQCNKCRLVCPVVLPNEFEAGMAFRKAIFLPVRNAVPDTYVVNINDCMNEPPNYLPCQRCVEVCEDNAIFFDMPLEQTFKRDIGSVIVTVGYDLVDPEQLQKFGYGIHPDILTSMELERLLTPTGPTGGYVEKPSNEECPENILFVLADSSPFSWAYSARHIARLVAQDIDNLTVLYPRDGDNGNDVDPSWNEKAGEGVKLVKGELEKVQEHQHHTLRVRYKDFDSDHTVTEEFDMLVLTTAVQPPKGLTDLAIALGIELGPEGFITAGENEAGLVATTRPGVCVAGCAAGPKTLPDTILESKAAASYALHHIVDHVKLPIENGDNGSPPVAAASGKKLTEAELHQRLEKFVWGLIALGESNGPR